MINVRILSMAIRTFFMANLDYAVAARASCNGKRLLCHALCVVGPLTDGDGGALRRCWRTPGRWPSFKEGQNVLDFGASQPARACTSVLAQAQALAGARVRESRQGRRGTPWHQARRQCTAPSPSMPRGWALAQSGRREPERERGQARRLPEGQFKLVPKRLMFLRLRLGVFLRKLEH